MKIVVIPAEVTTLEDTIIGKLTISQLILMCLPLFFGLIVFFVLPPVASFAWYKLALVLPPAILCGAGSLRISGQLLLQTSLEHLAYRRRIKIYLKQLPQGDRKS